MLEDLLASCEQRLCEEQISTLDQSPVTNYQSLRLKRAGPRGIGFCFHFSSFFNEYVPKEIIFHITTY